MGIIEIGQLNYDQSLKGAVIFLKGEKNVFGCLGSGWRRKIVSLQKGSIFWPKRLNISQNYILVLHKPYLKFLVS